jgi:dynein heavy chain 1
MNNAKSQQIRRTTISEMSFVKDLEMALRFGTPILLEDVDVIDPILNPILNNELKKVNGNNFIRLGEHDVPFSPTFMLYMSTRDASAKFTPDLCSRYA